MAGSFVGHIDMVGSVKFLPDGTRIVSGSYDRTIRVWDTEILEDHSVFYNEHTDTIRSVSLTPDGRLIAPGSNDHTIRI